MHIACLPCHWGKRQVTTASSLYKLAYMCFHLVAPLAMLTTWCTRAGLTPRFDLLEGLLRPLEQLPRKDQFFAFLTTEDGRAIPVSGLAYNTVMLSPFHVCALLEHALCKVLYAEDGALAYT